MIRVPSELVTTRDLRIAGVAVPSGTVLDKVQIESLSTLQSLLANGSVAAVPDMYSRRTRLGTPQPTYIAPVVFNAMEDASAGVTLALTVTEDLSNDKRFTVSIGNGNGPFTVAWGDTNTSTVSGTSSTHTYAAYATYAVSVTDQNGATGAVSIVVDAVPAAPTSLSATAGDSSAVISFTPGVSNNSAITNYKVKVDDGPWVALSPADASSPVTVTGLTNGVEVSIRLLAVNSVGDGAESDPVLVTPVTVPSAPTSLVATPSDADVSIAFTAGADGGSAITNYEYKVDTGAWTAFSPADTATPVVIGSLSADTEYAVALRAVNAVGAGAASDPVVFTTSSAPGE